MEKTSTPNKNNSLYEGELLTHQNYTYAYSEPLLSGNIIFKCTAGRCDGTIIVKKSKSKNFKFLAFQQEHSNRRCLNSEKDNELLYKTAVENKDDTELNNTSREIEAITHHRNLLLENVTKQKTEIDLLKQINKEKDTLIENLKTSVETTEAGWNVDKKELEQLRNKIRMHENTSLLPKSANKKVSFVTEKRDHTETSNNTLTSSINNLEESKEKYLNEKAISTQSKSVNNLVNQQRAQNKKTPEQQGTKTRGKSYIILGDEHVRDMNVQMKNIDTDNKYIVHCHPGKYITDLNLDPNTMIEQYECLILMGGSNDVFNNEFSIIHKYLTDLIRNLCSKIKIILVSIPYRYDKPSANIHIQRLNKKIRSIVNIFKNVVFLDINKRLKRSSYGYDKININFQGKQKICAAVQKIINNDKIFENKNNGYQQQIVVQDLKKPAPPVPVNVRRPNQRQQYHNQTRKKM